MRQSSCIKSQLMGGVSLALMLAGSSALAAGQGSASNGSLQQQLEAQQQQLDAQARQMELYQRALLKQQNQLDQLKGLLEDQADAMGEAQSRRAVYSIPAPELTPYGSEAQSGSGSSGEQEVETAPSPGGELEEDDRPPDVPILSDRGGVLLRQFDLVVEPSFEYTNTQVARTEVAGFAVLPAILIGSFGIEEVDRESFTGTLTTRFGITDRIEGEVAIPAIYRRDISTDTDLGSTTGEVTTRTLDHFDLGDIETAVHYQINDGAEGWPFFVGNLRYKSTTGLSPFDVDVNADG